MRNPRLMSFFEQGQGGGTYTEITLRDLAAIAALKGHLSADADAFYGPRAHVVRGAIEWADAMLAELEKEEPK